MPWAIKLPIGLSITFCNLNKSSTNSVWAKGFITTLGLLPRLKSEHITITLSRSAEELAIIKQTIGRPFETLQLMMMPINVIEQMLSVSENIVAQSAEIILENYLAELIKRTPVIAGISATNCQVVGRVANSK